VDPFTEKIVWKEAYDSLRQRCNGREPTINDVADVLEDFADTLPFSKVDDVLKNLPIDAKSLLFRGAISIGLATAKVKLSEHPELLEEIKKEGPVVILKVLTASNATTAYQILSTHPKLLVFVYAYSLYKLGVPPNIIEESLKMQIVNVEQNANLTRRGEEDKGDLQQKEGLA
jgi:predicted glycosyltransferase